MKRLSLAVFVVSQLFVAFHSMGASRSEMLESMRDGDIDRMGEIVRDYPKEWKGGKWNHDTEFLEFAPKYVEALASKGLVKEAERFRVWTIEQFMAHDKYDESRKRETLHGYARWKDPEWEGTGKYSGRFFHKNFRATMAAMDAAVEKGEAAAREIAARKAEQERREQEERDRIAREKAEKERKVREEEERIAQEKAEAERKAREEEARLARERERAERQAREEEERIAREKREAERKLLEKFNVQEAFTWKESTEGVWLMVPTRTGCKWSWTGPSEDGHAQGEGTLRFRKLALRSPDDWEVIVTTNYHRGIPAGLKPTALGKGMAFYGTVKDGRPHGHGVLLLGEEKAVVGTFHDSENAKGAVVVFESDNETYRGGWRHGKAHGKGVMTFADGGTYRGTFQYGSRHGAGILTSPDGSEQVKVFRQGLADKVSETILARLDSRKAPVSAEKRFRIARRVFWHQSNQLWINVILLSLFLIPLFALARKFQQTQDRVDDILTNPLKAEDLNGKCVLGGILGLHKIESLNPLWFIYPGLTTLWLMFNVSNIYRSVTNPSVAFTLWRSPVGAWIAFGILAALLLYDFLVGNRYDAYRFNAVYWRATKTEPIDAAMERATAVPAIVKECIEVSNENFQFLKEVGEEDVGSRISDWFSNGKIEREQEKLQVLKQAYDGIVTKSREYAGEASALECTLIVARLTATRNFKLAKEIFSHLARVKGKEEETIIDDLALEELSRLSIDVSEAETITVPPFDFDGLFTNISGLFTGTGQALEGFAQLSNEDADDDDVTDGLAKLIGGVISAGTNIVKGAVGIAEHYQRKKEIERLIVEAQAQIVQAAKDASQSLLNNKAKVLRAAEIVKALAKCNKAFVHAYSGLRDDLFGQPSFRTFSSGEDSLVDAYMKQNRDNPEFVKRLAHLKLVCSDYKKVSLTEVESEAMDSNSVETIDAAVGNEQAGTATVDMVSDASAGGSDPNTESGGGNSENHRQTSIPPSESTAGGAAICPGPLPASVSASVNHGKEKEVASNTRQPISNASSVPVSPTPPSSQDVRPALRSTDFIVAGIFTGWFGGHLAYAGRWECFCLSLALAVLSSLEPIVIVAMVAWWIASFFLVKKDGRGRPFRSLFDTVEKTSADLGITLGQPMTEAQQKKLSEETKRRFHGPSSPERSTKNRILYILLTVLVGGTGLNNLYLRSKQEGRVSIAFLTTLIVACILNAIYEREEQFVGFLVMSFSAILLWEIYSIFFVVEDGKGRKLRWF